MDEKKIVFLGRLQHRAQFAFADNSDFGFEIQNGELRILKNALAKRGKKSEI